MVLNGFLVRAESIEYFPPIALRVASIIFHCSAVKITQGGISKLGFGVSTSIGMAKRKAFSEAVERLASTEVFSDFNGIACHFGSGLAKYGAYIEALERDAYIKWYLGLNPSNQFRVLGDVSLQVFPTADPLIFASPAARPSSHCIKFGLGCGETFESAGEKAIEELALSEFRHLGKDCKTDTSIYGGLHTITNAIPIRSRLIGGQTSANKKVRFEAQRFDGPAEFVQLKGCHRWPLRVFGYRNQKLIKWDLNDLVGPVSEFVRRNLLEHFEKVSPEIMNLPIPVG